MHHFTSVHMRCHAQTRKMDHSAYRDVIGIWKNLYYFKFLIDEVTEASPNRVKKYDVKEFEFSSVKLEKRRQNMNFTSNQKFRDLP